MVTQYPHTLKFKTPSTDSVYDQNTGEWSDPVLGDDKELECRAEMNSKGELVPSKDGSQLKYAYTVYMNVDAPVFEFGQMVEVFNSDGLLIKDTVKKFSRGQLNARLWV